VRAAVAREQVGDVEEEEEEEEEREGRSTTLV
jgi:hypothetical protein